jgi:hypothetical protein
MCIPTVCSLSLSTTLIGLDNLIEQTDGLHLEPSWTEAFLLVNHRTMCAWYIVFKGKQLGVYTRWAQCSEHVQGYRGAVHKKYSSYEQVMTAFNSTINSMSSSKPSSSLTVTESGETTSLMSYKNVIILFLCALVAVMWMRLNRCNSC